MIIRSYKTIKLDQPFNLDKTLNCGQIFFWDFERNWWSGVINHRLVQIRQKGSKLFFSGADKEQIIHYFSLDSDLDHILYQIDKDPFIHSMIQHSYGLRIINQEPWSCFLSYLCSSNMKATLTKTRLKCLSERYGSKLATNYHHIYPSAFILASLAEKDIRKCKLGYRSSNLIESANMINKNSDWIEQVTNLAYNEAKRYLMSYPGVGPKVADCILLFSFRKYEAFPVDTHIRNIIKSVYFQKNDFDHYSIEKQNIIISQCGRKYFGRYAGYAGQYIFARRSELANLRNSTNETSFTKQKLKNAWSSCQGRN